MKLVWNVCVPLTLLAVFAVSVGAAADKEVTLKGKISCAKCELKLKGVRKCQTVIQVKEGDKEVTYFFLDRGNKETWHEEVCGGGKKDGSVTGVVSEKDGKKWIKPSKVEYAGGSVKGEKMGPTWMNDYAAALKCSRQQRKPLAIFIGCGADGWKNVVRGGKPSVEVERLLSKEFVCVYVNADTPAGKRLASALKVTEDMGLVLGDRTGQYVEHRHSGSTSDDELAGDLSRCCGMTMHGGNGKGMQGMANGSMNGSMGAAMRAPAACSCCCGR